MIAIVQKTPQLYWSRIFTPLGECAILATAEGICWTGTPGTPIDTGLSWAKQRMGAGQALETAGPFCLQQAIDELGRYFAGERVSFSCSLDLHGTPFQTRVWRELCTIPYGETRSYGEIARAIGCPSASRSVGAANGANPIAIIVPCHRVIGSNGSLTGYGGGMPAKRWLLACETAAL